MLAHLVTSSTKTVDWTADAAHSAGDVVQLPDGRAGVVTVDVASGDIVAVYVEGRFVMPKTTTMVMLEGSWLWWDYSADKVHLLSGNDRDFRVGTAYADGASAATTIEVELNVKPTYTVSLGNGFVSAIVQTAGFPYACGSGEGANVAFSATAEAQKADALSVRGAAPAAIKFVDALICVNLSPDNSAADLSIGLANGTHATDADSITESLFIHIDGASTNINAESDDGSTEVNATDTTVDYTAGTPFLAQWDLRDLTDIQLYIDGVNVLPSSVFKLNAATGPLKALLHMEKTSDDSPGMVWAFIGARTARIS